MQRERFRSMPLEDMMKSRDKLIELSNNMKYTPRTRELAAVEADYMNDLIAWRMQPRRYRQKMIAARRTPWNGWTRKELHEDY